MVCQECGNRPATLSFTKVVNGVETEFHICEHCAREKELTIPGTTNGVSNHALFSGVTDVESDNSLSVMNNEPQQAPQCEKCGLTYEEFNKTGRVGCDECYKQFAERLESMLRRNHGTTVHTGKVPKRNADMIHDQHQLEMLKKHLQLLIEQEEYEQAAKIRDQIRELEEKISEQ